MKKDTKKAKSSKTDKTDNHEKKTTKSELKPAKATKTGKTVNEPDVSTSMDLAALCKERHHIAAKISSRKKSGKDVTELKEQEKIIVEMIRKIKYAEIPTNPTKTKVKKAVEKPKKATCTNTLPAQARRITGTPHMGEQPRNEIWYTTNDGKPVDIRNRTFGRNVVAKDHTFDGKNGVIRCNGVITEIGSTAFYACHNLTSISIPKSVDIINTYAFVGCTNLTDVTCKPTTPPSLGLNIFTNSIISTVHVPVDSVGTYKSANGWVFYKENIVPFVK